MKILFCYVIIKYIKINLYERYAKGNSVIMKRFFVQKKFNIGDNVIIDGVEHNHLKNVLRLKIGDEIIVVCGDQFDYVAKIINISKSKTEVAILSKSINLYNPKCNLTVFQALVKSDNMSIIVQKLTELGVKDFIPFTSEFITSKDKNGKTNKLQEISNQSIKQCKRSFPMYISQTLSFESMLKSLNNFDLIVFANECEDNQNLDSIDFKKFQNVAIIVGSEGGFSSKEINAIIEKGAKSVSLGKRILRAETASIALTSVILYLMGEWS